MFTRWSAQISLIFKSLAWKKPLMNMDVDRDSFTALLPTILKRISTAHFVAFDFEHSGIPTQRIDRNGKPSLQQKYSDIKAAAERYHILQVGITCVEWDNVNKQYLMRPMNFNLSPLNYQQRRLTLERDFSYSSSAVEFLLRQNYRVDAPFSSGVPYMSSKEEAAVKLRAIKSWDSDSIPDVHLGPGDDAARAFMKRVRLEISSWKGKNKVRRWRIFC